MNKFHTLILILYYCGGQNQHPTVVQVNWIKTLAKSLGTFHTIK